MTYIVRIRGHEDINLDDVKGESLKEDWLEYKKAKTSTERRNRNHVVKNLNGFTGQLSDIQNFQYSKSTDETTKNPSHSKKIQQIDREDYAEYKKIVDKSPEEKSKDMEFAKSWHRIITGEETMEIETRKAYIDAQKAFFEENPYRTLPDVKVLDQVVSKNKASSDSQSDALFRGAIARVMANMVVNDYKYAKNRRASS